MKRVHSNFFLLKNALMERIVKGVYPIGGDLPPSAQLMNDFSVSAATVKRVYDDLAAAGMIRRRRGRSPVVAPETLRRDGQVHRVVIIRDVVESVFFEYRYGPWNWMIQQLLYNRLLADHVEVFTISKQDIPAQEKLLRSLSGAIYTTANYHDPGVPRALAGLGLPYEIVSAYSENPEATDMVWTPVAPAVEKIAVYLLSHGVKTIDVIGYKGESDRRMEPFFALLAGYGFASENIFSAELSPEEVLARYTRLPKGDAPCGIVCYGCIQAETVFNSLIARGWRPKQDFVLAAVSVLDEWAHISGCPLRFENLVNHAVERFYRRCHGGAPEPTLELKLNFHIADT